MHQETIGSDWEQVRLMKVIRSVGGRRSRETRQTLVKFSHLEGDATLWMIPSPLCSNYSYHYRDLISRSTGSQYLARQFIKLTIHVI